MGDQADFLPAQMKAESCAQNFVGGSMLMRPGRLRVNWLLWPSAQQLRRPWLAHSRCALKRIYKVLLLRSCGQLVPHTLHPRMCASSARMCPPTPRVHNCPTFLEPVALLFPTDTVAVSGVSLEPALPHHVTPRCIQASLNPIHEHVGG